MMLSLIDPRLWNKIMICTGTQLPKKHKTRIPHVKPHKPINMFDVFYAQIVITGP